MSLTPAESPRALIGRNRRIVLICAAVFALMVAMAFAAVPFYRAFCQATGFNGAVKRASFAPGAVADTVTVRFDANVNGLDWTFKPVQPSQTIHLGAATLAFFRATNTGTKPVTGRALFNVVPEAAGQYFNKLECFCFRNQTLQPGQTAEFPVVYYVAPGYAKDRDTRYQHEITLSYTFFPAVTGPRVDQNEGQAEALGGKPAAGL
ncbi:MAG: cytochrome c oxidase assembly protein [Caulobacteraceae bacterium]|nr:cytochrome c oxidase assembly protein [Caulobacteraceae bacterium]